MKNFNQLINEPLQNKNADTNEMIGLFLASMCLAYAIGPILNKGGSGGSSSSGASFWDFMINRDNNKQKEREAAAQNKNSDNSEQPSNGDTNNGQDSVDRKSVV